MFYNNVIYQGTSLFDTKSCINGIYGNLRYGIAYRVYLPAVFFDSVKIIKSRYFGTRRLKVDLEGILVGRAYYCCIFGIFFLNIADIGDGTVLFT